MPSINMIAGRRAEKRRQEQNTRKLVYAIVAELGFVLLAVSFMMVRMVSVNGHISDLGDRLKTLQPKVAEIQQLQQETAQITPKVQTLDGAKADTLFWYTNLYAITSSLPQKTWITSLGTTGNTPGVVTPGAASGEDPTMSVSGMAMDQDAVGEAMLRMNQAPSLDHVVLAFVQQQKIGLTNAVQFQMTVHLKPEPSAVAAAKGDAQHVQKS